MVEDKLQQMDPDKRTRLINAAIDEFSHLPFGKASTNSIVKKAGISKGLLFHYFTDKQDLYDSLSAYVITTMFHHIEDNLDWSEPDLIARIRQIAILKLQMEDRHPGLFDFVYRLIAPDPGDIDIGKAKALYRRFDIDVDGLMQRIYSEHIDFTRFRDPGRVGEYIELLEWTMEGISKRYYPPEHSQHDPGHYHDIQQTFDTYTDILKRAIYKDPEGGEE